MTQEKTRKRRGRKGMMRRRRRKAMKREKSRKVWRRRKRFADQEC